jgi:peptidoglycan hydrolase-like amidase/peptidoglycan hydrolase CwlO-like protein
MKRVFVFILIFLFVFVFIGKSNSQNLEELIYHQTQKEIDFLNKKLSEKTVDLQKVKEQIALIKQRIKIVEEDIVKKEVEVKKGEEALSLQKNLLNERAKSYYKNLSKASFSLVNLLVAKNLSSSLENFFYQKSVVDEDKNTIIKIVLYIKNLEEKKKRLEEEQQQMLSLNQQLDALSQKLGEEISQIQTKIAQLTAKQQELIAKKFAENPIPRSAGTSLGGCLPDYNFINNSVTKDPGFSPKYAFFSLGSPNKVGLNQFGAYGRSKNGQKFKQILEAYYNNIRYECRNFPNNKIKVKDTGEVNIKDYLKLLGEMPMSWGEKEAYKAQIVAASSYAYSYTNGGEREICYDQNCQVFLRCLYLDCNTNQPTDAWKTIPERQFWYSIVDEVNQECGDGVLVMVSNDTNEVIKAWYSSTHGGIILRSGEIGWSDKPWTKHAFDSDEPINSLQDLLFKAYDSPFKINPSEIKSSPWFYCNWGSRPEYGGSAWLTQSEVLEIVNAYILFKLDPSTFSHLSQVDKNIPDTWDDNQVRQEIKNRGGNYFSKIDFIQTVWDGTGISHTITVRGDIGEKHFNAQEFKDIFNLRARGNLIIVPACVIKQSNQVGTCQNYALYDVVIK